VFIHGNDVADMNEKQLAKMIGVVLTARPDVQNMTVEEMVGLGRSPYTGFWGTLSSADREIVREAIDMVGITDLSNRMIQNLSDGERQKVMIAKALAQQTPVIFLDEPTAFLDYPSKVEMMQTLHHLSRTADKTIFLSTHDLELALQIADMVWLMGSDGTLSIGTPKELANSGVLGKFVEQRGIVFDRERLSVRVMPRS
jgi:iron complex transport system ATP-binding protein